MRTRAESSGGHTPGPWHTVDDYNHGWEVHGPGTIHIAGMAYGSEAAPETEENAKLIARAPDLLTENARLRRENAELVEALEAAVSILGRNYKPHYDSFLMQARAAIERAREETR